MLHENGTQINIWTEMTDRVHLCQWRDNNMCTEHTGVQIRAYRV
jgi:hypothetical protein